MTDERDLEPLHGPDFVLDVENFGPIAEARDIAFKPMTVFVGPSNTGKSYLTLLMHAILQGLVDGPGIPTMLRYGGVQMPFWQPSQDLVGALVGMWREAAELTRRAFGNGEELGQREVGLSSFAPQTQNLIQENLGFRLEEISRNIEASICGSFEVDGVAELAHGGNRKNMAPIWTFSKSSNEGKWNSRSERGGPRFCDVPGGLSWRFQRLVELVHRIEKDRVGADHIDLSHMLYALVQDAINKIVLRNRSWYLPTSRTGILVSHRVLTDSILSNAHNFGLEQGRSVVPRYHKVAADFLRAINGTDPRGRWVRPRTHGRNFGPDSRIAASIERSVLSGQINVETNEFGPPEFSFAPDGNSGLKVPMMRSSSMATELAPIVAFLRSHIEEGDLLIIEEPEAHLHPSAQQRLAGVLAYMVRKGLRVLITTHSHYMVEAMGMFLNSSRVDPDKRADSMRLLGDEVDRELYLNEDEVAVYSFDSANEVGTVVKQVPFDEDSLSFAPESYSDALVDQFNRISRVVGARIDADELAEAS